MSRLFRMIWLSQWCTQLSHNTSFEKIDFTYSLIKLLEYHKKYKINIRLASLENDEDSFLVLELQTRLGKGISRQDRAVGFETGHGQEVLWQAIIRLLKQRDDIKLEVVSHFFKCVVGSSSYVIVWLGLFSWAKSTSCVMRDHELHSTCSISRYDCEYKQYFDVAVVELGVYHFCESIHQH